MKRKKAKSEVPAFSVNMPDLVIHVEGMTCQHCKAKVEQNLGTMDGVTRVVANIDNDTVSVSGSELKPDAIRKMVRELGYTYKGPVQSP